MPIELKADVQRFREAMSTAVADQHPFLLLSQLEDLLITIPLRHSTQQVLD